MNGPALLPPDRSAHCGGAWRGGAASLRGCLDDRLAVKTNWSEQLRREPAVVAALVVFAGTAATILGAWYFQYVLGLAPCPLCLEQRVPYYIVVPLSLLLAIGAIVRAPRVLIIVGFLAIIAAMLCSAALGAYHAGRWNGCRWYSRPTVSGRYRQLTPPAAAEDALRTIRIVHCDEAAWRFLGLSLAGYNALISLALAGIAALGLAAHKDWN